MSRILKSARFRNVFTLLTGTGGAQLVAILGSFLLARLYSPDDFGIFATLLSVAAILSVVFTYKYEMGIVLPERGQTALHLVYLSILLIFLSLLIAIPLYFMVDSIPAIHYSEVWGVISGEIAFVLGLAVVMSVFNVFNYLAIRWKHYRSISYSLMAKAVVILISQALLYWAGFDHRGLVLGQIFGFTIVVFYYLRLYVRLLKWRTLKFKDLMAQAKRYIDFPRFTLPGGIANTLSLELNNIFILALFSSQEVGYYFFAYKILGMPISLIGKSYGQVYFQEAVQQLRRTGSSRHIFVKALRELSLIALLFVVPSLFLMDDIMVFLLGKKWQIAGEFAQIMVPLFGVRLVSSSLSVTVTIHEKQMMTLLINLTLLIALVSMFYFTAQYKWAIDTFLYVFTYINSFLYILFLLYYYKLTTTKN